MKESFLIKSHVLNRITTITQMKTNSTLKFPAKKSLASVKCIFPLSCNVLEESNWVASLLFFLTVRKIWRFKFAQINQPFTKIDMILGTFCSSTYYPRNRPCWVFWQLTEMGQVVWEDTTLLQRKWKSSVQTALFYWYLW